MNYKGKVVTKGISERTFKFREKMAMQKMGRP